MYNMIFHNFHIDDIGLSNIALTAQIQFIKCIDLFSVKFRAQDLLIEI